MHQMAPIQRGLEDRHPYVRRTAVMGVLKVYTFDAGAVLNAGARYLCVSWYATRGQPPAFRPAARVV